MSTTDSPATPSMGFVTAESRSKTPPIGVPFKPKRKGTRYEIQLRVEDEDRPTYETVAVVVAHGARKAITDWIEQQEEIDMASDELKLYVRAVPVSRITQVTVAVEQKSTLSFS